MEALYGIRQKLGKSRNSKTAETITPYPITLGSTPGFLWELTSLCCVSLLFCFLFALRILVSLLSFMVWLFCP